MQYACVNLVRTFGFRSLCIFLCAHFFFALEIVPLTSLLFLSARDCMSKMHTVTAALELMLGPDTTGELGRFFDHDVPWSKADEQHGLTNLVILPMDNVDLTMRMGLHSGPVTAGVLRGRKSHFQLFGDTVNTGKSRPCKLFIRSSRYNADDHSFLHCHSRAYGKYGESGKDSTQ